MEEHIQFLTLLSYHVHAVIAVSARAFRCWQEVLLSHVTNVHYLSSNTSMHMRRIQKVVVAAKSEKIFCGVAKKTLETELRWRIRC